MKVILLLCINEAKDTVQYKLLQGGGEFFVFGQNPVILPCYNVLLPRPGDN